MSEERTEVTLRLDADVVAFYERIAKLSGVAFDDVLNVFLALDALRIGDLPEQT